LDAPPRGEVRGRGRIPYDVKPPPFPEAQELKEFNEETLDFLLGELKTRIAMVDEISVHLESKTLTLLGFVSGVMLLLARFAPDVASYRLLEGSVMYGVSVLFGLCELSLSVAVLFLFGVITPRQNAWPQLSNLVEKSALVEESRILKPSILWSLVDRGVNRT